MTREADQAELIGLQQPTLIVVAGPNGAGKTSLTEEVLRHQWFEGCVYVNPDQIAQERFGDWNSPDAQRVYVYDNSIDNSAAALQFRTEHGLIKKAYQQGHRWADLVLEQVIQIQPANPDHDPWEDSH